MSTVVRAGRLLETKSVSSNELYVMQSAARTLSTDTQSVPRLRVILGPVFYFITPVILPNKVSQTYTHCSFIH